MVYHSPKIKSSCSKTYSLISFEMNENIDKMYEKLNDSFELTKKSNFTSLYKLSSMIQILD